MVGALLKCTIKLVILSEQSESKDLRLFRLDNVYIERQSAPKRRLGEADIASPIFSSFHVRKEIIAPTAVILAGT
jgi:hypothetical protein